MVGRAVDLCEELVISFADAKHADVDVRLAALLVELLKVMMMLLSLEMKYTSVWA